MNKQMTIIVAVLLVLIGGGVAYLMMQEDEDRQPTRTTTSNQPTETSTEETPEAPAPSVSSGQYVEEYDESMLATTPGTKIIFFHAPWCPQCVALEKDILAKGVPEDVTIFKVDYDTNQELRQKYGVTLQTTLVEVDENGNEIAKFVAYDEPTLEAVKRNLLD